ncbi:AraC family transcriptional regulator [Xanthomonas vasicola]|uniref:AraC family transcriptional regulator n=1 Tax=Xanthomonas vasicola TaxID=56459 RepID=A0ABD7S987_XANVA|nr:AraC family transcriptional regulator [Xanthomonas vasicola]KGR38415.1 AraC family transcriptional regulator [Xanthomonas vasicola]KGR45171.1 AraC family transcriptional regulator [Xanthomonas vasicola]KGR61643.1 AraC family transcriptional regulator [Xanthomonas vasicola]PPV04544.1 AraC family transcriptional regulator [Xanthomonas vasicola]
MQQGFALSRASLYRLFQSHGGVTSYIREQRVSTAHRYLQACPDCSLTWLLYEMGFASERQLQRAFQQRSGMPPMQWRRQCRAAPHTPTSGRGHYMPMWRFMRELSQNTQRAEVPVRAGMLPLHNASLVHTEALRRLGQPLRARAIELEYVDS